MNSRTNLRQFVAHLCGWSSAATLRHTPTSGSLCQLIILCSPLCIASQIDISQHLSFFGCASAVTRAASCSAEPQLSVLTAHISVALPALRCDTQCTSLDTAQREGGGGREEERARGERERERERERSQWSQR